MRRLEQEVSLFLKVLMSFSLVFVWAGLLQGQDKGWEKEWDKTIQAAKKEGQLVFHSGDATEAFFSEFQKKFPEIKVTRMLTRGGNVAVQRLMSERRAGLYTADILIIGASSVLTMVGAKALDPIEPVMALPEVLDKSKWWEGKHHYADKEGRFLLKFGASPQVDVGYNTKLVNPNEIKSYWDLVNPKWKGRIVTLDPAEARGGAGVSFRFMYYHPELGPDFIRRLFGEMALVPSRDGRLITDWLAQGKFALSVLTSPSRTGFEKAKAQGLPVDWFAPTQFREGVNLASGANNVALINRAPHPNAAKLFINWFLSREGQIFAQKVASASGESIDSLRIDIPKDDVPPDFRRQKGIKYFETDRPEWMDLTPITKLITEVWKPGSGS